MPSGAFTPGGKFVYKDFYSGKDPILVAMTGKLTPITDWNPDIPKSLWRTMEKALLNNPQKRYRTAGEFANALRAHLE